MWDDLARALSPVGARPRVVPGIEVARYSTRAGAPYVVVRNPAANTYLKLQPRELGLLQLMDGTRTVKDLVIEDFQRHGVLAPPRVLGLVELLRDRRFLTEVPLDAYALLGARLARPGAGARLSRLARGFLYTEFPLRHVDTYLNTWYQAWARQLFTPSGAIVMALLAVLGPLLLLHQYGQGRYTLFKAGDSYLLGVPLYLGLTVIVLTLHEIGHGLAVKHAGRVVGRAGFLIYYGCPAAFVDTTDVWMAPRSMRLLVSFAGPMVQFVLGGVCAIAALLLPPGPLGVFLFACASVCLLDNLLNFNPLLELDGYYLLVDFIEKPMLRARSFAFVRGPLWKKLWRRERLTGEEVLFATFGLASAAFSALMVLLVLRFWERQVREPLVHTWDTGGVLGRAGVLLLLLVVLTPLAFGAGALVRRLAAYAWPKIGSLRRRAAAELHRDALSALRAVPHWRDLPEPRQLEIARAMRARSVAAGTPVVSQGEPGEHFYIIDRGVFEVLVDGRVVNRLGRGDYFGERALLHDSPRAATVLAVEPARVFSLDRATFDRTLARDLRSRARLEAALAFRDDVAAMPLFHGLTPAELDLLLPRLVPVMAEPGVEIVRQGDPGDRFYIIRSGSVEVVQDGQVIARRGRGEAFGEIALLFNVPRVATVRASEPTGLLALSAQDFHDVLAGYLGREGDLRRLTPFEIATHKRLDRGGRRPLRPGERG